MRILLVAIWIGGLAAAVLALAAVPERSGTGITIDDGASGSLIEQEPERQRDTIDWE